MGEVFWDGAAGLKPLRLAVQNPRQFVKLCTVEKLGKGTGRGKPERKKRLSEHHHLLNIVGDGDTAVEWTLCYVRFKNDPSMGLLDRLIVEAAIAQGSVSRY